MRRAVSRFVTVTAFRHRSVGFGAHRRAHRGWSANPIGAPTEQQQAALFEHYVIGLREILSTTDDLADPLVVDRLRVLRSSAPVALERPFWGAQFLAMAFGHELGFASAHPPALKSIFNLGVAAAEQGLVPFHSMRAAHGQLKQLGLLECSVVDPPCMERESEKLPTAWSLFASKQFTDSALELSKQLEEDGVAVVDDVLGPTLARAVELTLKEHASNQKNSFTDGQLDATGRSNKGARGDKVTWLSGDEGLLDGAMDASGQENVGQLHNNVSPGAVAQWMRSTLGEYLLQSLPPNTLLPTDAYVSNAMLSVYSPGAPGFVPHLDNSSVTDPRRITAVYYPNDNWDTKNGGELVLHPNDVAKKKVISPIGDRLVLFWSDEVEHEVLGVTKNTSGDRLAVSFWFLKPRNEDGGVGGVLC